MKLTLKLDLAIHEVKVQFTNKMLRQVTILPWLLMSATIPFIFLEIVSEFLEIKWFTNLSENIGQDLQDIGMVT